MKIRLLSGFGKWIMAGGYCYCLVAGLVACTPDRGQVNVIPLPNDMEIKEGFFEIDSTRFVNEGADKFITCHIDSASYNELGDEGYELSVSSGAVHLNAATGKGAFYGKQTLRQLVSSRGIPCVEIKDTPRFGYRGLHVDVSRHFFPKEEITKLMDEMAFYKLNKFHFHLTDNGGWRIQIDKYPRLTSMGAFRTQCEWVEWWDKKDRTYLPEGTPNAYGGYYTKEDIREIVAYAEKRCIEVIPEIEFPAHSDEVFVGYPELCCMGKPYAGGEFCAGNEQTYTFMEDVLTEVIDLFPSAYVHIGGDEARKVEWKNCPIIYRVVKHPHHRTGTTWKAYPMYDFAHGQSDFFEGVTHSLCTLEFVVHRPLYDLFIDWLKEGKDLNDNRPRQTEFNKLNLSYTLMSKRNLLTLVKEGLVNGWDDPRMPTICGFRRRGYSPESIHKFIDKIGYTTYDALNDIALLESSVRDDLNSRATRVSAVINPVKLIITNYPEGQVEELEAINNPEDPEAGSHMIEFSRELWMEREDFMEDAPKKYFRMTPGQEVRLKNAYIVKCTGCKKDENGVITEVYCEYDANTRSGMPDANRKVKGTLHWVSCNHCLQAEVRLYDRLWKVENPRDELAAIREAKKCEALEAMKEIINPDSLKVLPNCYIEKFAATLPVLSYLQFQRIGYFNIDKDSTPEKLVFNRTVGLKDTWGKINK